MNHKTIFCIIFILILTGCAAQNEPVSTRPPKKLITQDDYGDLDIKKTVEEEPYEVDYQKEGTTMPSIDTRRK